MYRLLVFFTAYLSKNIFFLKKKQEKTKLFARNVYISILRKWFLRSVLISEFLFFKIISDLNYSLSDPKFKYKFSKSYQDMKKKKAN